MRNSQVSFLTAVVSPSSWIVVGERIVTPSSIVSLTFRARYVYPTTSLSTAKPVANGDSHSAPVEKGEQQENGGVREASVSVIEDDLEKVEPEQAAGDVKEKIVEAVTEKVEEAKQAVKVGRKGKVPVKDEKVWASNGYAYAPHWPMVSLPERQQ